MSAQPIVRCTCGAKNRWPASWTRGQRVRCAACKADLPVPLSLGGGSPFAAPSPFDDSDLDDDDEDLDDDEDFDD